MSRVRVVATIHDHELMAAPVLSHGTVDLSDHASWVRRRLEEQGIDLARPITMQYDIKNMCMVYTQDVQR